MTSAALAPALRLRPMAVDVRRRAPLAPSREDGRWDADEVAHHLLQRRGQLVGGLAQRSPWRGLADDALDELFGEAVSTVVLIAGKGRRRDWRRVNDLERATIAAFRHAALAHRRSVMATKRTADRLAIEFHPELHGGVDHGIGAALSHDHRDDVVAEVWLAELTRGPLRDFWRAVLVDELEFRQAGDRLGLTKAEVMAFTRVGRERLGRFAALRRGGLVCAYRAEAIRLHRAGTSDAAAADRATAHLATCLACALVHDRDASALQRGVAALALPLPLLQRLRDVVLERALGISDAIASVGPVAKLGATGLAAATLATAVQVAPRAPHATPRSDGRPEPTPPRIAPSRMSGSMAAHRTGPPQLLPTAAHDDSGRPARPSQRRRARAKPAPTVRPAPPPPAEFGAERPPAPRAPSPPSPATDVPATEFNRP